MRGEHLKRYHEYRKQGGNLGVKEYFILEKQNKTQAGQQPSPA